MVLYNHRNPPTLQEGKESHGDGNSIGNSFLLLLSVLSLSIFCMPLKAYFLCQCVFLPHLHYPGIRSFVYRFASRLHLDRCGRFHAPLGAKRSIKLLIIILIVRVVIKVFDTNSIKIFVLQRTFSVYGLIFLFVMKMLNKIFYMQFLLRPIFLV